MVLSKLKTLHVDLMFSVGLGVDALKGMSNK